MMIERRNVNKGKAPEEKVAVRVMSCRSGLLVAWESVGTVRLEPDQS